MKTTHSAKNAEPLDPDELRKWAGKTSGRVAELERRTNVFGMPFPVRWRTEGPLSVDELAARMVRNGADPADAAKRAREIITWR